MRNDDRNRRRDCMYCCSSVSSSLSGSAANCWEDILKLKLSEMTELRKALVNRLLGMSPQKLTRSIVRASEWSEFYASPYTVFL